MLSLTLAVKLQRLDDGVLDLLRRRPRRKILADAFSGHSEMLLLIGLLLLHDGKGLLCGKIPLLGELS